MGRIKTYEDLLEEEQRLRQQLKIYEVQIRKDLVGMKENIEPARKAYNTISKVFTRDNRVPIFNIGLEMGLDLMLRRFILRKAGWFTKIVVPYFMKNYASHIIGEEKRKALVGKIQEMFAKFRPKPEDPMKATTPGRVYE